MVLFPAGHYKLASENLPIEIPHGCGIVGVGGRQARAPDDDDFGGATFIISAGSPGMASGRHKDLDDLEHLPG